MKNGSLVPTYASALPDIWTAMLALGCMGVMFKPYEPFESKTLNITIKGQGFDFPSEMYSIQLERTVNIKKGLCLWDTFSGY